MADIYPRKRYTTTRRVVRRSTTRRAPVRRYAKQIPRGYPTASGVQGELKAVDTSLASAVDTTGAIALLNGIARGDDIGNRVGRQVTCKYLEARIAMGVTSGTGEDQYQRILIVQDRQPNGTALAITDVLVATNVYSQSNLDNRLRFRILYDKWFPLNASAEAGSAKSWEFKVPLNFVTQFNNGDAGTIADIQTNSLYAIVIGSKVAGVTAGSVAGRIRVRFTDK